jgi:hypothetical protein
MLERVVANGEGVSFTVEEEARRALAYVRRGGADPELLRRVEQVSVALATLAQERGNGLPQRLASRFKAR